MIDTGLLKSSVKYDGDSMSVTFGSNIPYHGPIQELDFGRDDSIINSICYLGNGLVMCGKGRSRDKESAVSVHRIDARTQEQREFDEAMEELEAWLRTPSP